MENESIEQLTPIVDDPMKSIENVDAPIEANEESLPTQSVDDVPSSIDQEWLKEDNRKFLETHPENDLDNLLSDPDFIKYAEKRVGVDSMSDIYNDYHELIDRVTAKAYKKAQEEAMIQMAKARSSPGSLTQTASETFDEYYTIDQIKKMTNDQIDKNWEKVQRSIQRTHK